MGAPRTSAAPRDDSAGRRDTEEKLMKMVLSLLVCLPLGAIAQ